MYLLVRSKQVKCLYVGTKQTITKLCLRGPKILSFTEFKAVRLKELCSMTRTCDPSYVSSDEGDYSRGLYDLIELIRPKSVIEIGSYRGVSTEIFLLTCPRVVAVDPWEYPDTLYKEFMDRV